MSKRAQKRRLVPGLLLLILIATVWASLALEAPLPVKPAAAELIGGAAAEPESETSSPAGANEEARRDFFADDVPLGFGEVELLPAVVEALGGGHCDIDDPFSTCQ